MDFLFKNRREEEKSNLKTISEIKNSSIPTKMAPKITSEVNGDFPNVNSQMNYQNPFNKESSQDNLEESDINPFEKNIEGQSIQKKSDLHVGEVSKESDNPIKEVQISNQMDLEEKIEEIVEKVLESKWEEFTKSVKNIINWKDRTDSKFKDIDDSFEFLKNEFSIFQKKMLSKIEDYDTNILDVNSELKAFEKVFSKITPVFVNNIEELREIIKDFKDINNKKKFDAK